MKVLVPPSVGDHEEVVRALDRDGHAIIEVWDEQQFCWKPGGPEYIRPMFFGGLRRLTDEELAKRGIAR